MRLGAWMCVALLAAGSVPARAADQSLDPTQRQGRQLFVQSCGICHMKPSLTSALYGPALHKETVAGREDAVRGIVLGGSPRMPGFQYELEPGQIDAIVQYLKTVPAPAAAPAAKSGGPGQAD
jgi:mono/diheme cytochrome c family protein